MPQINAPNSTEEKKMAPDLQTPETEASEQNCRLAACFATPADLHVCPWRLVRFLNLYLAY